MVVKRNILKSMLLFGVLTACGQATNGFGDVANKPEQHTAAGGHVVQPSSTGSALQAVVATSELVVGSNRVALGLLENMAPIPDAAETRVHTRYYKLNGQQATLVGEEDGRFYGTGLGARGTLITKSGGGNPIRKRWGGAAFLSDCDGRCHRKLLYSDTV